MAKIGDKVYQVNVYIPGKREYFGKPYDVKDDAMNEAKQLAHYHSHMNKDAEVQVITLVINNMEVIKTNATSTRA